MSEHPVAKEVRRLVGEGELLEAVDVARAAVAAEDAPLSDEDRQLVQIEEIVALSRMASLEEAQEKFAKYELDKALNTRAQSLKARFKKDLGFSAEDSEEKRRLLTESRDLYLSLARERAAGGPDPDAEQYEYNGINALTLSRIIGDLGAVSDVIEALEATTPADHYWSRATRAEFLLAKDAAPDVVKDALELAVAAADTKPGHIATTLRQLRRVAPDHPALSVITPGPVLHYSGHMIAPEGAEFGRVLHRNETTLTAMIEAELEALQPSAVFGSLASGADIITVEWALRSGRDARVFLPFNIDRFFAMSIAPAGEAWVERARACLAHEDCKLSFLTEEDPLPDDDYAFNAVSRFAMGGAILRAERDGAEAAQLLVWDREPARGVAGAAADGAMWGVTGRKAHIVDVSGLGRKAPPVSDGGDGAMSARAQRVPKAIIFGDVKNFSKLKEAQLPDFVSTVMGAVAEVFALVKEKFGEDAVDFSNTWGDGVFAVFGAAGPAAWFALELQERMTALKKDFAALGLPEELAIRLGLHFGVVFPLIEPVTGSSNFFGEAVARAARIEPITKEGRIFVSEEFAAELALDPESPAVSEYVGEVDTAKKYGRFRLYRIRKV